MRFKPGLFTVSKPRYITAVKPCRYNPRFFITITVCPASYRVPPRARHLPTAFVRSGPQEAWVPKRGSYHSTTATSVRGSHGQTTRRAPPEAADGRETSRGGEILARDARSRIGWIVSRTTSKRSEPQTALRWTTGSHSELTEPYGPLRRRWTMGRRRTKGGVEGSG